MSRETGALSVIYTSIHGNFYITHFVEPHGPIDSELIWQLFHDIFGRKENAFPQYIGPFVDLEAVTKFSFRVCDEAASEQVNLVNLEEFNQLIESSPSISNVRERLTQLGNVLVNPDAHSKKGLFGKLFN